MRNGEPEKRSTKSLKRQTEKKRRNGKKERKKKTNGNFITEKHVKPKYQYQWIGSTGR